MTRVRRAGEGPDEPEDLDPPMPESGPSSPEGGEGRQVPAGDSGDSGLAVPPAPRKPWFNFFQGDRPAKEPASISPNSRQRLHLGGEETVIERGEGLPGGVASKHHFYKISKRKAKTSYQVFETFFPGRERRWKIGGRHIFLARYSPVGLMIEPLSVDHGIFERMKANKPMRIKDRGQFLIGRHLLEYRAAGAGKDRGELVVLGADGQLKSQLTISSTTARIGRGGSEGGGPSVDLALLDRDVSRVHALLEIKEDGVATLTDLAGEAGTFLRSSVALCLKHGGVFRALHYYFLVEEDPAPSS